MLITRSLRSGTGLMALAALMLLVALHLGGCSETTAPEETTRDIPPVLPDPAELAFDFSFFAGGETLAKSDDGLHTNFVNAYLRAVLLQAMADLALAPPVAAFAVALHTVPVAQEDGAWIWSYDWNGYRYPIRVALRGLPAGDHVEWEMRIGPGYEDPTAVWFEGRTNGDGSEGHWLFHDLDDPAQPVCAEVDWGRDQAGRYLQFTSRELETNGDVLRFNDADPDFAITFTPGDGAVQSFIRWHADGTGSLRVPDYNGGQEACWDQYQENCTCP
jgi:hypothetical protein